MFQISTRFLFYGNEFSRQKKAVKKGAFTPDAQGKKSIFGISGLKEAGVWEIGIEHVAVLRGLPLKARGDFPAQAAEELGLRVVPDGEGHPRHANLEGWPENKDEQKALAIDLAAAATLRMKPEPA